MSDYLNILSKVGPTPQEIAAKQKEMERAAREREEAIKAGAKEEIANLQGRISELREDPNKTHMGPIYDCHPSYHDDMSWLKEDFGCAAHEVALSLTENSEDEAEAIKGYTEQINRLKRLLKITNDCVRNLIEKDCRPEGPETPSPKKSEVIQTKIDYFNKVAAWVVKNISATQEKIKDELNHSSLLLSEYIEFTGITPSADGIKEAAKTISGSDKK